MISLQNLIEQESSWHSKVNEQINSTLAPKMTVRFSVKKMKRPIQLTIEASTLILALASTEACCFSEECCPEGERTLGICHGYDPQGDENRTTTATSLHLTTDAPASTHIGTTGPVMSSTSASGGISTDSTQAAGSSTSEPQTISSGDVDTGAETGSSTSDDTGKPTDYCAECKFEASKLLETDPLTTPWFIAQFYNLSAVRGCNEAQSTVTHVTLLGLDWFAAGDNLVTISIQVYGSDGNLLATSGPVSKENAKAPIALDLLDPTKPIDKNGFWVSYYFGDGDAHQPDSLRATDTLLHNSENSTIICVLGAPPDNLPLDPPMGGTCSNTGTSKTYLPVRLTISC